MIDNRKNTFQQKTKNTNNQLLKQLSPPSPILQAVWIQGHGGISHWDQPIDGVTWYADHEGLMWFVITNPDLIVEGKLTQYQQLQGPDHKQPYSFWVDNHLFHLRSRIEGLATRIDTYRKMRLGSRSKREMNRGIGDSQKIDGRFVEDEYNQDEPEVDEKSFKTHFLNHYSPQEAYMDENYRNPAFGKKFFASDVFLDQLTAAANGRDITEGDPIQQIPERMPTKITRATISNNQTKSTLLEIFGPEVRNYQVRPGDAHYQALIKTPNGAATINILSEYNVVNRIRGLQIFSIDFILVKKTSPDGGWFMEFHFK